MHRTESDVARASALYFLQPVDQGLSAHQEVNDKVRSECENVIAGTRSDLAYSRFVTIVENRDAFAVVEYKKRGVIHDDEFNAALIDITPQGTNIDTIVKNIIARNRGADATLFKKSSLAIMKQASAYAISHGTRYVAVFNWDVLLLIKFCCFNPAVADDGVGSYCEISYIPNGSMLQQPQIMRKALLGFLFEAYRFHTAEVPAHLL
ncbi:hypothetical protein B0H63DRAFT_489120 [Podospora didyma]|uniref:Uncharacterized protein n=1 Tax=Podospora didyma TaxID=330526 RepID=A0AAE0K249_9PEZI|nr:hypothetical protein B0H63DRAFT_489120 [Podospora didyma]